MNDERRNQLTHMLKQLREFGACLEAMFPEEEADTTTAVNLEEAAGSVEEAVRFIEWALE